MASIVEIREMSEEQIEELLEDAREEMFNLRFQRAIGQLEDYRRIRQVRRDIARYQEVLHKRESAIDNAAGHPEIAAALANQVWSAAAYFDYEESAWLVKFTDDGGDTLAAAKVDLNKKKLRGRRDRNQKKPVQHVLSVEIAG
jgi:large subunit ribosomal protein L29